jgi:RND family efflux transporter MFP subunit
VVWWKFTNRTSVKTIAVRQVTVTKKVVVKSISASGKIVSESETDLSFPVSQKIVKITVAEGDNVTKGQLLAVIENQSTANTVQSYKDARDISIRQKELFELNADDNKEQLGGDEQYRLKLREYDEEISRTAALYIAQLALLKNNYLYAPFSGTVVKVNSKVGEVATAGSTVVKIADLSQLFFELDIDQEDFGNLKINMPASVTLDAYPSKELSASITKLPLYVDEASNNSFTAQATFNNLFDVKPYLGMTGDIKVITQATNGEVNALYYDQIFADEEDRNFVWIQENGVLKKHFVETGLEGDIYTEIKQDIAKNIVVPVSDDVEVKEGYKARVIK